MWYLWSEEKNDNQNPSKYHYRNTEIQTPFNSTEDKQSVLSKVLCPRWCHGQNKSQIQNLNKRRAISLVCLTYYACKPFQKNLASLVSLSEELQGYSFLHQQTVFQLPVCKNRDIEARKLADDQNWWLSRKRWVVLWLDQKDGMTLQMWFSSGMGNRWSYKAALIKMNLRSLVMLWTGHNWKEGKPNHLNKLNWVRSFKKTLWNTQTLSEDTCGSLTLLHISGWNLYERLLLG